jgi:hypothetical protein
VKRGQNPLWAKSSNVEKEGLITICPREDELMNSWTSVVQAIGTVVAAFGVFVDLASNGNETTSEKRI